MFHTNCDRKKRHHQSKHQSKEGKKVFRPNRLSKRVPSLVCLERHVRVRTFDRLRHCIEFCLELDWNPFQSIQFLSIELPFMLGITATQREEDEDDDITTRVRPPPITAIPQESDIWSTSSGTQKKSNERKDRLVVVPSKSSFLQQLASQQRARQKERRKQQQQQTLLATAQASTTAMFCPVPWFIPPPREVEDKSARSITSTIPPQEYLSYQSNELDESCSHSSGIELGEPTLQESPKRCLEEASSIQTPPPTSTKTRALTPETQAMTEADDGSQSVSSEASSTSRIELPRPRALLFEESMKKIAQETRLNKLQDELFVAEADASTTTILSPLRFVVFAIVLDRKSVV